MTGVFYRSFRDTSVSRNQGWRTSKAMEERLRHIGKVPRRSQLAGMLLAIMFSASLHGQNPSGSLRGLVQDASGARVAAASIEIHVADSSTIRRVSSDGHGQFFVQDLPAGRCEITVSAAEFAPASAEVATAIGTIHDIVVTLQPASVQQTIGVRAQASSIATQPIDAVSDVHQSVVSSQDLETLPLPARSFADIAYLAPGTEPVEPSDPTKARITAGCLYRRQFRAEQRTFRRWRG